MLRVIIIGLIVCLAASCRDEQSTAPETNSNSTKTNAVTFDTTIIEFGNIIPNDEALRYIAHYNRIYNTPGRPMTKSVWFTKELFKYIYETTKDDASIDGVRIFLGAYDTPPSRVRVQHPNQISLFMVATKKGPSSTHINDFDIFKTSKAPFDALNHGELCPPNTGCETVDLPSLTSDSSNSKN